MTDIFISYAREDQARAAALAKALEDKGWSVWWDPKIPPGKTFDQVIEEVFKSAKCVLVLWSNDSINSEWVHIEASGAAQRKVLVPALIDNVEIPFEFKSYQAADLTDWEPESTHFEFGRLLRTIAATIERPTPPPSGRDTPSLKSKGIGLVGLGTAMIEGAVACFAAIPKIFKLRGNEVYLGASAPAFTQPKDEFTARFVAYAAYTEEDIEKKLRELSPRSSSHLGIKRCQWKSNTEVTVSLSGKGLEVDEAVQSFIWKPPHVIVDFDVHVPPDASCGTTVLKFDVFIEEIRVAKLRIDLQIADSVESEQRKTVTSRPTQTAFASYSSKDEKRVIDRMASVEISAGIDVFYARKSMKPGDNWKSRIPKEILERDQFLLFWSKAAAVSKWVEWEWQFALNEKGKEDMQIHPLQNDVPPPADLSDLHFNDIYMDIRGRDNSP